MLSLASRFTRKHAAEKKVETDSNQQKLSFFPLSAPATRTNSDMESVPGPSHSVDEETKVQNRKYLVKWEKEYEWLRFDSAQNKMYCKLCEENGKHNSFTEGCNNLKKSAMEERSVTKDHRLCLQASSHSENNAEVQKPSSLSKEKGASVAVRAAH